MFMWFTQWPDCISSQFVTDKKLGNYEMISEELKSHDWNELLMEDAWKKFKDILHKAIEKHVPVITVKKSKASSH